MIATNISMIRLLAVSCAELFRPPQDHTFTGCHDP